MLKRLTYGRDTVFPEDHNGVSGMLLVRCCLQMSSLESDLVRLLESRQAAVRPGAWGTPAEQHSRAQL